MTQDLKQIWWYLMPICGLELAGEDLSLDAPILPDIAFISASELKRLIDTSPEEGRAKLQGAVTQTGLIANNSAFIAIKIASNNIGTDDAAVNRAELRADEFMALLMFLLFSETSVAVCGLTARASRQRHDSIAFDENLVWHLNLSIKQPVIFGRGAPPWTSGEILPRLKASSIATIAEVVLADRGAHFHDSVLHRFKSAVRILAHAIYTNQPGEMLTGIVTMFEVALSENNDRDEVIKKRIRLLTGSDGTALEEKIYKLRNGWVHDGVPVTVEKSRAALGFALSTLASFAKLLIDCPKQTSWVDVLAWLDAQAFVQLNPRRDKLERLLHHFQNK